MVEVPVWAMAAFGVFSLTQLIVILYLLRSMLKSIERNGDESKLRMKEVETQVDELARKVGTGDRRLDEECTRVDKKFLEVQLANTRMYVDREIWTRDYVTMSQRITSLHQRIDRMGRSSKRPSDDPA